MEAGIEQRLSALERRLGLPEYDGTKSSDIALDVIALKRNIAELGYGFIFKIDTQTLKSLCEITEDPKYITFGQKRATIDFGYDLMMERIKLLEQFQKSSEVVFNSEQLKSTNKLQPALDSAKQEMVEAAEDVNKHLDEINNLKENFCDLVNELQAQLKEFDEIITKAEKVNRVS